MFVNSCIRPSYETICCDLECAVRKYAYTKEMSFWEAVSGMASKAGQVLATLGNVDDDGDAADDDGRGGGKGNREVCEDRTLNSEMELQRVSSLSVVLQCVAYHHR